VNLKTIAAKAGEITAIAAVLAVVSSLWIDREVERRMNELAQDPAKAPVIVELITEMDNVEVTLSRVETKVDAFSEKFLEYLQRQTN